jgi:hypothetical protein
MEGIAAGWLARVLVILFTQARAGAICTVGEGLKDKKESKEYAAAVLILFFGLQAFAILWLWSFEIMPVTWKSGLFFAFLILSVSATIDAYAKGKDD